jgi:acyl carrier protein|tara:strand:+ start:24204 stop:24428 length:225 start_codon:yes stop_codon:yes gene_type:complete
MKEDKFISDFIGEFEETPEIKINLNTEFRELNGWDSMTSMMVITMIDENYNVIISPEEIRKAKTVGNLFDLVYD